VRTWVKLYTEINRDPKMLRLTWAHRGIWSALLALAGEIDDQDEEGPTGYVGPMDDAALLLRCDDAEFAEAVEAFEERGMVRVEEGILYLTRYADRQKRAPSSRREAVAERVKRHRRRKADARNVDVTTLHPDETTMQRGVTPPDTDTDTDTETDTESEPESDALSSFSGDAVHAYENAIGLIAGETQTEEIKAFLADLHERGHPEWWQLALDVACDNNARKWSYIRAVLRNWLEQGRPGLKPPSNGNRSRASPMDKEAASVAALNEWLAEGGG
jgi:DnaD/phage-associated family protein